MAEIIAAAYATLLPVFLKKSRRKVQKAESDRRGVITYDFDLSEDLKRLLERYPLAFDRDAPNPPLTQAGVFRQKYGPQRAYISWPSRWMDLEQIVTKDLKRHPEALLLGSDNEVREGMEWGFTGGRDVQMWDLSPGLDLGITYGGADTNKGMPRAWTYPSRTGRLIDYNDLPLRTPPLLNYDSAKVIQEINPSLIPADPPRKRKPPMEWKFDGMVYSPASENPREASPLNIADEEPEFEPLTPPDSWRPPPGWNKRGERIDKTKRWKSNVPQQAADKRVAWAMGTGAIVRAAASPKVKLPQAPPIPQRHPRRNVINTTQYDPWEPQFNLLPPVPRSHNHATKAPGDSPSLSSSRSNSSVLSSVGFENVSDTDMDNTVEAETFRDFIRIAYKDVRRISPIAILVLMAVAWYLDCPLVFLAPVLKFFIPWSIATANAKCIGHAHEFVIITVFIQLLLFLIPTIRLLSNYTAGFVKNLASRASSGMELRVLLPLKLMDLALLTGYLFLPKFRPRVDQVVTFVNYLSPGNGLKVDKFCNDYDVVRALFGLIYIFGFNAFNLSKSTFGGPVAVLFLAPHRLGYLSYNLVGLFILHLPKFFVYTLPLWVMETYVYPLLRSHIWALEKWVALGLGMSMLLVRWIMRAYPPPYSETQIKTMGWVAYAAMGTGAAGVLLAGTVGLASLWLSFWDVIFPYREDRRRSRRVVGMGGDRSTTRTTTTTPATTGKPRRGLIIGYLEHLFCDTWHAGFFRVPPPPKARSSTDHQAGYEFSRRFIPWWNLLWTLIVITFCALIMHTWISLNAEMAINRLMIVVTQTLKGLEAKKAGVWKMRLDDEEIVVLLVLRAFVWFMHKWWAMVDWTMESWLKEFGWLLWAVDVMAVLEAGWFNTRLRVLDGRTYVWRRRN